MSDRQIVLDSGRDRPTWWTENNESNPTLIAAQILAQKGHDVRIDQEAIDQKGRPLPGRIVINGSDEGKNLLNQLINTPELNALAGAVFHLWEPATNQCSQWEEQTRRKVLALYWQNKALFEKKQSEEAQSIDSGEYRKGLAQENQRKAESILGELEPLTADQIRSLVEQAANNFLRQSSITS
ncbi:hypothetical protein HYU92_03380 [Candidatus Curtissbacteria bacterium]|nr:hypothetical protein [Candidatus Curtissbacteria bacterium]